MCVTTPKLLINDAIFHLEKSMTIFRYIDKAILRHIDLETGIADFYCLCTARKHSG